MEIVTGNFNVRYTWVRDRYPRTIIDDFRSCISSSIKRDMIPVAREHVMDSQYSTQYPVNTHGYKDLWNDKDVNGGQ